MIPAAMEALRDSARPAIAMVSRPRQAAAVSGLRPLPSLPMMQMLPGPSAALCTGVAAGSTTQAQPVIPRACRAAIAAPISPTA